MVITGSPCTGPVGTYGWVPLPAGATPTPNVRGPGGTPLTVVGSVSAPVGAPICLSGPLGGFRCGTLVARNLTLTFADGRVVRGVSRTTICALPGEAGAPFVTVGGTSAQAQGVLLVSESCSGPSGGHSYFFPITRV